jgi:signal transduction histidine kinase
MRSTRHRLRTPSHRSRQASAFRQSDRVSSAERLYTLAHDVKNLLSGVECVLITTLKESKDLRPKTRALLEEAGANCRTLNDMIQSSLEDETQSAVSGREEVQINLACVLAKCVRMLRALAEERNISFRVSLPPDVPNLLLDERRLTTTLLNLLHNSLRFSPCGKRIDIDVKALGQSPEKLIISVTDEGAGISPAQFERIMSATCYEHSPAHVRRGHTGLSYCSSNVQALGGEFWLESPPYGSAQGSRFSFTLPITNENRNDYS